MKNVCGKRCKISEQKKCFSNRQYLVSSIKQKFFNDKNQIALESRKLLETMDRKEIRTFFDKLYEVIQ